ncbi:DNA excision repair protein ERCC-5 homolog [Dermatophagoides pteronyssinus]|uniref:DNA excision repair protein ERCC-5 homolog n=1 Tax=Dermatophagoides pteronyssinus TaxID=6956 RepID=UPI003F679F9E
MGVTGLWSLIEDAGTRVDVQTLNQKILAIDLSIWINQSIKGFRDREGRSVENAHLLGLFYRICKLLFYQIKPIVVFDGECPTLKLHTVQKRLEKTRKNLQKSKNLSMNVLENYISSLLPSKPSTTIASQKIKLDDKNLASQIYLPREDPKQTDIYQNFAQSKNDECKISISDEDEEEIPLKNEYYHHSLLQNLHDIDINSQLFKMLPAVTRYEILVELRDSYKNRKNTNIELLPKESNSFSQFQMAKLLKKRSLQEEIEKLIKEFNNVQGQDNIELLKNTQHSSLDIFASKSSQSTEITTGSLASDEQTRFLLLKTLNQAIEEFTVEEEETCIIENDSQSPIYKVPNGLPGQSKIETDVERIELLSKSSEMIPTKFSSKQLSQDIDRNFKKYSDANKDTEKLVLSDNDETDSTNSEDFIEVPVDEQFDDDSDNNKLEEFDESLPYDTSYAIDIHVKEASCQEKMTLDLSNKSVEIITDNEEMLEKQIVEKDVSKISEEKVMEIISQEDDMSKIVENDNDNKETIETPIERSSPIDFDQMIKDSKESAKLSRQANSVTSQMINDCQQLLRLFGIPWIVAPGEAEAQCACLESLGLCEGIITDDSDVFLFGGQNVYRNFFTNSKFIMRYRLEDFKKYYGLDRHKFICLGMLCGTDYTLGIDGVGPVTGIEILSQFPGEGLEPLNKFSKWYREKISNKDVRPENPIRAKLLRLLVSDSFPNRVIFDAYQNANVNDSNEPFSWSMPQLSELRQFATERFGWSEAKTDAFLLPVLKSLNSKQTQKKIDFYFKTALNQLSNNNVITEKLKIKRSKRLNEAIRKNLQLSIDKNMQNDNQSNNNQGHRSNQNKKRSKSNKFIDRRKNKRIVTSAFKQTSPLKKTNVNCLLLSEESSSD